MKQQLKRMVFTSASMFVCGIISVQASLIASEDFEYTGTSLLGQNGGAGWGGAWIGGDATLDDSASLTVSGQPSAGGHVSSLLSTSSMRQFSSTAMDLGSDTTFYASFLLSKASGGSTEITFNYDSNASHSRGGIRWDSADLLTVGLTDTTSATAGTYSYANTLLVVMKFEASASANDAVSVAVFEPGDSLGTEIVWDATDDTAGSGVTLSYFRMKSNAGVVGIDALKIGTTLADVVAVPEPISAGLLGSGALFVWLLRRRLNIK